MSALSSIPAGQNTSTRSNVEVTPDDRSRPRDTSVRHVSPADLGTSPLLAIDEGFRGPQVCRIVGVSYRQLDYWARTNLVRPSISEGHGSGTCRRYSAQDLVRLAMIRRLLDSGVSLQKARVAIEALNGVKVRRSSVLVIGDDGCRLVSAGDIAELVDSAA